MYNNYGGFDMDKLDNIVNNYKNANEITLANKKDAISQLLELRKRTIRLIDNANKTLEKRREELKKINDMICLVKGHSYSDWEEHDGFLDRTWYYTRCCEICGEIQRVDDEPVEYRAQVLKRKRSINDK